MNLLLVMPSVPLPSDSGGSIRSAQLLSALAGHFRVTVLTFEQSDRDCVGLRRLIGPNGRLVMVPRTRWAFGYRRYTGDAIQSALDALLRSARFDLVHFDHLHTAQLLPRVRSLQPGARVVIDEHNVEHRVLERMAETCSAVRRLLLRWHAGRVRRLEQDLVSRADAVLACSQVDGDELAALGAREVHVVPNGIAIEGVSAPRRARTDLVFVGSQDWWPNADASVILARRIWPLLEGRVGDSRLQLVGRNPPPRVAALEGGRICVTGRVDSVAPFLARSWATAMPLRAGSGTRLKILEAAAAGVPIVTSRIAAEGLPLVHGENALFAESDREFADQLIRLYQDRAFGGQLAERARPLAEAYQWSSIGRRLVELYGGAATRVASAVA